MIKKITHTIYKDEDNEFEYQFEPVDDSIIIEETAEGYKVKYLVQDENAEGPDSWDNDDAFLVHYHRSFQVESKEVKQDDLAALFHGEKLDEGHYLNDYHIFFTSALIHSGVWLKLGDSFASDAQGWDTSRCGAVLIKKKEFGAGGVEFEHTKEEAETMARSIIDEWNKYLSGDVYGCVVETFDKDKKQINDDSRWGFYGFEYATERLKTDF